MGFRHHHTRGSHYYFIRYDQPIKMTHVQYHGAKTIDIRTMKKIVKQSGIPESEWFDK